MVILVLGNGFDLAHNLPTSYPDFLKFVKVYWNEESFPDDEKHKLFRELANRIRSQKDAIAKEALTILTKGNQLLAYFLSVYEQRIQEGKNGWIDFEAEIASIIKAYDDACEYSKAAIQRGETKYPLPKLLFDKLAFFIFNGEDHRSTEYYKFSPEFLKEFANHLLLDLNDITRLFEIYITELVEKQNVNLRIPEIYKLGTKVDRVISFNYTDTYRRLYRGTELVDCCFIHGKADEDSTVETCNLVLGIDEYLEGSRKDKDNAFIWFKKFYQRIYKETSSEYIDWLDEHTEENMDQVEPLPLYIYFYGHSLDVTDKDVLGKLIKHDNAEIRIYYHNKEAMAKQISNLVKVIGADSLIQMTRGQNRKIRFLPASKAYDEAYCKAIIGKKG